MNLQQFRCVAAIAECDLNLSAAASKLHITQSAVSKQLRALEEELGFLIFVREGRAISSMTAQGERVIGHALRILRETRDIRGIAAEFKDVRRGALSIGATHTQAKYVLPRIFRAFREIYPLVRLRMYEGSPEQLSQMAVSGRVDLTLATAPLSLASELVYLPCYEWSRRIVVLPSHPLAKLQRPLLSQLAQYPLMTHEHDTPGLMSVEAAFAAQGLSPRIALTAREADVIKTYVRVGLGVGVVPHMTVHPERDADLVSLDASHLFPLHTTLIAFARQTQLRRYTYDFLELAAPHLTKARVEEASVATSQAAIDQLFVEVRLPVM